MCRSGAFKPFEAALVFMLLLHCVSAHVTFKLPSLPGVSPGNAGGYGASMPAPPDRLRRRTCGRLACRSAHADLGRVSVWSGCHVWLLAFPAASGTRPAARTAADARGTRLRRALYRHNGGVPQGDPNRLISERAFALSEQRL